MSFAKSRVEKILKKAGLKLNGQGDADPAVHNEKLYRRVLLGGSLALGESYMNGWWEAKTLDQFFHAILSSHADQRFQFSLPSALSFLHYSLFNLQNLRHAFEVGQKHYDIGNDIYKAMLGKSLVYSCGYWARAKNLDEAQFAKLDLICQKIGLKKGDTVLDIGCGWGSFLKFAAENYSTKGVGITVSEKQADLARELCKGLPIEIKLQDYRTLEGRFDHIVSVGMFEHVGVKNYHEYMETASKVLKNGGMFLLHTIGSNKSLVANDPWIEKYIFPNGMLPSVAQIGKSVEGLFVMEDWHNFGADYDKTLMAWFRNFDAAWPKLKEGHSQMFYRMWKYYLLSCAGEFRARNIQLWQVVLSKKGVVGGYKPVR